MNARPGHRALPAVLAAAAALGGALVAVRYARLGLTLSHYDARGHLVVARRIIDSLTPGWQQVGAVWLPLPHLLNALPVQVDAFYRTGASGVAISVACFAVATGAIASIVLALTGSSAAALAGAAVFALNPNVLYLQATPMTEPLLLALTTLSVAVLMDWCGAAGADARYGRTGVIRHRTVGGLFALACLTRYEAWPVTVCALAAAVWARWRQGDPLSRAARQIAAIAVYPAGAVAAFLVFSRVVIGQWFVSGGFFVPENDALGKPVLAAAQIWWGTHMLSGYLIVALGAAGLAAIVGTALVVRERAAALVAISLAATAALPWTAFLDGHPFRIRYMVPLVAAEAVGVGVAFGFVHWALSRFLAVDARSADPPSSGFAAGTAVIVVATCLVAYELRPLDASAPMVVEAQWDRPNQAARQRVTACLAPWNPGAKIMASMGSLGHYMQEASRDGFAIRDFLHEGNGDVWLAALDEGPRRFADWVMIEEKAEGGDMLAERVRKDPHFLDGYVRVCEGAGLALYKRTAQGAGLRALGAQGLSQHEP